MTQQSVVPADATFTAAGAPNAGHADQQSSSSDADPSTQQSNSYNGGYSIFAAAPPSLQAIAPGYGGAQQASSEQLNAAQVIAQVAYALQVTHQSGQQMQLLLNPPDLGSLQVNVTMHDGVLSARLETQTPATQQILVDNLSQLKDSLNQQGVAFDRIDVRLAGSSSGTGGWGSPDPSFGGQQEGALPYDQAQSFAQTENDDPVISRPSPNGSGLRTALTSLDVKV
ncbi:MAG TPA: flagellar hook-length control protein FliK [Planctomycetaceae bacterium]|nr:flagellar hook-length control protein FliK [Planctomycetaceae bacterium]